MKHIRKRFTKWYIKRGYVFGYKWIANDENVMIAEAYYICPWWVKPLLIFFSPSIYFAYVIRPGYVKRLRDSMSALF